MKNILLALKITQKVDNEARHASGLERIGKGYWEATRYNPYNPLTYLFLSCVILVAIIAYGIVGFREVITNPFRWE